MMKWIRNNSLLYLKIWTGIIIVLGIIALFFLQSPAVILIATGMITVFIWGILLWTLAILKSK